MRTREIEKNDFSLGGVYSDDWSVLSHAPGCDGIEKQLVFVTKVLASGTRVVIKLMHRPDILNNVRGTYYERLRAEAYLHMQLAESGCVPPFFEVYDGEWGMFFAMEYMSFGDGITWIQKVGRVANADPPHNNDYLNTYVTRRINFLVSEHDVTAFAYRALFLLRRIHSIGIVHRDVKPDNFLFSDSNVSSMVIGDFGLAATTMNVMKNYSRAGTLEYVAPEIVFCPENISDRTDIWALGVSCFLMAVGYYPLNPLIPYDMRYNLFMNEVSPFPLDTELSTNFMDLVNDMLSFNPKKRPSACEALEYPIFDLHIPTLDFKSRKIEGGSSEPSPTQEGSSESGSSGERRSKVGDALSNMKRVASFSPRRLANVLFGSQKEPS